MTREFKSAPQHVKAVKDRTVTGIFSTYGVTDSYDDIMHAGAFAKTLLERGQKIVHLWQHDFASPPTAIITELRELARDELPSEIRSAYPDAGGGMEVTREYLDTPRGNEVLTAIKAGSPLEMSFAYDAVKYDFAEKPGAKYEWERIRNIREVRLYETSDVLWGANSATVAHSKAMLPFDLLLKQLQAYLAELKEGRRNNAGDQDRINTIARLAAELGADNIKVLEVEAEDEAKSRAAADVALTQKRRARAAALALRLQGVK
jgi:HK97 family phage prohead protease